MILILIATLAAAPTDLSRPVSRLPGFTVNLPDYPFNDWRQGHEGRVKISIDIDTLGKPNNCVVVEASRHPGLDAGACKVTLARMRFSPALDASGSPIISTGTAIIRWKLRAR